MLFTNIHAPDTVLTAVQVPTNLFPAAAAEPNSSLESYFNQFNERETFHVHNYLKKNKYFFLKGQNICSH